MILQPGRRKCSTDKEQPGRRTCSTDINKIRNSRYVERVLGIERMTAHWVVKGDPVRLAFNATYY